MPHLPAAEIILKQFLKASDDIISRIPPQENFFTLLSEPRFARSLSSLRLLVQHHLLLLLKHLEGWRASTHGNLARMPDRTDRDRIVVFSKRFAMEVINFEAALQLLDLYSDEFLENKDFKSYCDGLQKTAFRVLLIAEDTLTPDLASLYKVVVAEAARVLGAISRRISLSHVVEPFTTALMDRINPKKDASGAKPNYDALRAQIVRLASGMRNVCLSFESEEAVHKAVSFLLRVHPLNYTAPIKKSQIHHALADMLTCILLPLVRSDAPQRAAAVLGPPALERWYAIVMTMRNDIATWMNKHQKHVNDGYPLATALLCVASDKDYSAHVDTAADFLHKGLKVKENRTVCVRCLVVLACSYLVRYGAHIIKLELHKWLDRVLRPVTQLAKKGGLTIAEQMDVVAPIAELSPEFALQYLILELLTSDANDCVLAGLRALQALILTAPSVAAAAAAGGDHRRSASSAGLAAGGGFTTTSAASASYTSNGSGGSGSGGGAGIPASNSSSGLQALLRRTPVASYGGLQLYGSSALGGGGGVGGLAAASTAGGGGGAGGAGAGASGGSGGGGGVTAAAFAPVNDMLRRGLHPLEVLGVLHLLPRVSAALAKLLTTWHPTYGTNLLYGAADANWKEKAAGFPLLLTLVRLLPYLKPDTWPNSRPLDVLPSYTCHAELSMRIVAEEALLSLVRGCPHLRNTVVCAFASFTAALPDDAVQSVRDSQRLLRDLMELWIALLAERAAGDAVEAVVPGPGSGSAHGGQGGGGGACEALSLDLHRLEGYSLVCMASHDEAVRREALQVLHLIRALHHAVLTAEPYEPPSSLFPPKPGGGGNVPRNTSSGGLTGSMTSSWSAAAPGGGGGRPAHGLSASRESLDVYGGGLPQDGSFTPAAGKSSAGQILSDGAPEPPEPPTYLVELVEEAGPALLRAVYWDFGDFSDLWRQYKPVQDNVTFEDVLVAPTRPPEDLPRVRLARALLELMGLAVRLVPGSAAVAAVELMARLGRMLGRTPQESRLVLMPEYLEPGRRDAWRNCSAMLCPCPQALRDRMAERMGRRLPPITSRDIIRVHLGLLTASATASSSAQGVPATIQLCSMLSLGHLSPDMYGILLEEMQPYMDEYLGVRGGGKSKSKMRDELRRCVAHVFRILSERVVPEVLTSNPLLRSRLLEFVRDTYGMLRGVSVTSDTFWEAAQVAYCLTAVVRNIAVPLRQLLSQTLQGGLAATGAGGGGATPQQLQRDSQGRGEAAAGGGGGGVSLRKLLWEMMQSWCEEAFIELKDLKAVVAAVPPGGDMAAALRTCDDSRYLKDIQTGINAALQKFKESPEGLREELHLTSHHINHSARLALAALLEGPLFDSNTRRPTSPVFTWIDKLLAVRSEGPHPVAGPPRRVVGHRALRALLTHNPDLFGPCLDKCYDSNTSLASGYFQVMCEVYGTQPVRCEPHIVLALVLVKVVDPAQEVREDALHMLNVLSQREWQSGAMVVGPGPGGGQVTGSSQSSRHGASPPLPPPLGAADADGPATSFGATAAGGAGGGDDGAVLVIGSLQDSYQQFQYGLAGNLAREHPELSEALCEELMTRQLECDDGLIQHPVLTSLAPWMENLSISFPWRGNWSERLLKSMYYVTLRHGTQFPAEIQRLWTQLAKRTRNINPILDFLLHLGMATALQTDLSAMLEFFAVAKRIVLFLARVSPKETIGYLAIELAKQQQEEGEPQTATAGAGLGLGGSEVAAGGGGVAGSRGTAASSGAKGGGGPVSYPHVLVFGGPLDCVVGGEDRTLYTSYESLPSLSSLSMGRTPSTSGMGPGVGVGPLDGGGPASVGVGGAAAAAAGGGLRNHSMDQGPRPHSGRSEASGSSRSEVNGLAGGGGGGGGGASSLADSGSGAVRGLLGGVGFGGPDHRLRPADDSRSAGAGGGGGWGGQAELRASQSPSASPSRAASAAGGALQQQGNRALLTRPELVLCCLAEVVYEHEVDPQHLPLLLHMAVTCGDHEEHVVAAHCQQLIVNLLYSRSAQLIDLNLDVAASAGAAATATGSGPFGGGAAAAHGGSINGGPDAASPSFATASRDVAAVIRHLQALRGRRLWPFEEYDLVGAAAVAAAASPAGHLLASSAALGSLTVAVTEALSYEPYLAMEWAARALDWAQHARSRHAACRSWQVLRALRPPLKADLAAALVLSLEACFQSGLIAGAEVAVEVITTTRLLVEALPPGRMVLYPQLWWAALALLHSPHVAVYRAALGLLAACLGAAPAGGSCWGRPSLGGSGGGAAAAAEGAPRLRLSASKVQAVLLAAAPGLSAGQLLAASHAAATQDSGEDADPWVLGYHVLNVREGPSPGGGGPAAHGSIAVQQLLLRGLTHPLTVSPSLHMMAALGEALAQQASVLLSRSSGPTGLPHTHGLHPHPHIHTLQQQQQQAPHASVGLQPLQQQQLLGSGGDSVGRSSGGGGGGGGGGSQQQQPGSCSGSGSGGGSVGAASTAPGGFGKPRLAPKPSLPCLSSGLDGDAADDPLMDSGTASRVASALGRGGGGGGSLAPHSDSLRKHRALKLDSFQTLLGSCRSQLFVSLMGLLPLMLALHGNAAPPASGGGGGGGGSAATSTAASEDFPQLQPHQHSRAARSVAAAAVAATATSPVSVASTPVGVSGGADADELAAALQRAVTSIGRAAAVLGMGSEVGAHLQLLTSPQLSLDPELLESCTIQLLTLLARALFPRYAAWFLHTITDLLLGGTAPKWASAAAGSAAAAALGGFAAAAASGGSGGGGGSLPPGPRQVRSALLLLRCLFRVEGLRLGPAASVLLADGTLLQPVVALTAGPLSSLAMETLAAALQYSQGERFQRDLREAAARAPEFEGPAAAGMAAQLQLQYRSPTAPRTLFPPATSVAAALKKVVDTLGSSLRRRNKHVKLLPFLGVYND